MYNSLGLNLNLDFVFDVLTVIVSKLLYSNRFQRWDERSWAISLFPLKPNDAKSRNFASIRSCGNQWIDLVSYSTHVFVVRHEMKELLNQKVT